ncbi:MAG: beta-ketoacyl-ACP synthase II [Gemmatimonadetes bacterium]|nr:beta-ketoacyl-ACP synthase II [Gemmatimonadota bacterium]
MGRRVVVTGMGLITALGKDLESSWEALLQGQGGVHRITRFDPDGFATQIAAEVRDFDPEAYIPKKEVRRQDLFTQLAVAASDMALADSGVDMDSEDQTRVGVIIGSGIGGIATHEIQNRRYLKGGPSRISPFYIPMMIPDMASGVVSMRCGAKGPNYCTVSACASSAHAIGDAFRLIKHGDAEVMIAGGTEAAVTEMSIGGFAAMKAMSTRNDEPERACRPFDAGRDGFVLGEGAGMAILEELDHAHDRGARIYAEVVGVGMTADAYHITAPAPEGEGAARAMQRAIDEACVEPTDIDYINAHGTSTPLNDAYETQAIKTVFGDHASKIMVGSTKSMTGHLLGGAGGLEFVVTAMVLATGKVPPTINYEVPDPECDLDYVPNEMRQANVVAALTNSFGFGGHNATLALKQFEE